MSGGTDIDLRCGRWQDTLADVTCDVLIVDPPYSARTHSGYRSATDYDAARTTELVRRSPEHGGRHPVRRVIGERIRGRRIDGGSMPRTRFELQYTPIDHAWVTAFCDRFVPCTRVWFVIFGDHVSARWWDDELTARDLVVFAPVPWVRTDAAPRFMADGPANACEWITIARQRGLPEDRRSRVGWYSGSCQGEKLVTGGKPLWLMRALVRDYSRSGDVICDPCAGGATTLIAAAIEGRRAIGSEMDPVTHAKAMKRIARGYTPTFDFAEGT
jgi:hypothetical protein